MPLTEDQLSPDQKILLNIYFPLDRVGRRIVTLDGMAELVRMLEQMKAKLLEHEGRIKELELSNE